MLSKGSAKVNKYLFTFPYNKIRTVGRIMENTEKPHFISIDKKIYAKSSRDGNHIRLYHGNQYRNSFMPIFELILKEKDINCTSAIGFWRWHFYTIVVTAILVYMILRNLVNGILSQSNAMIIVSILFLLFYTLLCVFGIWLERKNMKKIIEHLRIIENK